MNFVSAFEYACEHPILLFVPAIVIFLLPVIHSLVVASAKREEREREEARIKQEELASAKKEKERDEHRRFVAQQRRLMTDSLRYDVMQRDGFRCQLCGATAADGYKLHVDHIIPVSKGGKTEMGNLRTLCERCNMGKGAKIERPIEK